MANARVPDSIHALKGTYRKDRHGDQGQKLAVDSEIPDKPDFLTEEASGEWDRVTAILYHKGLLTQLDRTILAQYCMMYGKLATEKTNMSAADHTQLRLMEQELGFTPSSRGKIAIPKGDDDDWGPIN